MIQERILQYHLVTRVLVRIPPGLCFARSRAPACALRDACVLIELIVSRDRSLKLGREVVVVVNFKWSNVVQTVSSEVL